MPYKNYILILLFELGFGIQFNLIGTISISEIFLLLFVPLFILTKINWSDKNNELRKITLLYAVLLLFQILSECMVGNDLPSALKGLAITIVSYLHFMFLAYYLARQKTLILILIISQVVGRLLFGSVIEEQSAEEILKGEGAAYLKFYVAPLVSSIFLVISILSKFKNFSLVISAVGIIYILLGARSSGGSFFFTGMITYMLEHKIFVFNKKMLAVSSIFLCIIAYGFYVYYINGVLSGEITSGNSRQVFMCNNPYNPLELLMAGRSEAWVGWQAFMDKFWFGHGAWAYDTTGHYQRLMFAMHGEHLSRAQLSYHFLIPSHSVLIGSGMMNGVFAFVTMGVLVFYFLRRGIKSFLRCEHKYKLVLVYYVITLFWTTLFSPQSHFRSTMPIAFAIIFVLSSAVQYETKKIRYFKSKKLKSNDKNIGVNSDVRR